MSWITRSLCEHKPSDMKLCELKNLSGGQSRSSYIFCNSCGKIILDKKHFDAVKEYFTSEKQINAKNWPGLIALIEERMKNDIIDKLKKLSVLNTNGIRIVNLETACAAILADTEAKS